MYKRLLLIILTICMLASVGCRGKKRPTSITFSENGVLTLEVLTAKAGGTAVLPRPAGTHAAFCVGWAATADGKSIFLPVGASFSYTKGAVIDFSPVYLHLKTLPTALLDLSVTGGGIQYTSTINAGEWKRLASVGANPKAGTLIVQQSTLDALNALTHAELASLQSAPPIYDCPATMASDATTFDGLVQNISLLNRPTPFVGIGYVQLTYSDGSTAYVYAKAEEDSLPAASLLGLSKIALEDLSPEPDDTYVTRVGDKYSPYTPEEYLLLQEYSKITISLVVNKNNRGNRGLASHLLDAFEERTIQQGDSSCADEWRILRGFIDIKQNGALVISAKDGTPIERDNITAIIFRDTITIKNAVYYNGSIYIPYSTYSDNY